ncbi:MAG: type I methionyl aminopeptidase [Clostridia bacterium]|nr:type I methionyl aminopeptidase [Clostridia bacterium]
MISIKNPDQLAKMRSAGHLLHDVLCRLREAIQPGVTTKALDAYAEEMIRAHGAIPSFLNYHGYPASICASIEDEVVHGIPSDHVTVENGVLLSIDCGLILDGWQADSAFTAAVGNVSEEKRQLVAVTEESFWKGAFMAQNGNRLGDIGHAVQSHAEAHGYGVIRDLTGHGIGRNMHEDPSIPNYGEAGRGVRIRPGMTLAIEPMIALGRWQVHQLADGWTIVTNDHSPCAHYEHTVAVVNAGPPEILTLPGHVWKEAEA